MMKIYTVSFFGHRQLDNFMRAERQLEQLIRELLSEKEYVEFLVGRNGDFDQLAASVILHLKRTVRDNNSSLVLVLPYLTAEYTNNQSSFESYYNEIEVCQAAAGRHFKSSIQTRNREIVDRSDLVICYIARNTGGAYQAMQYAQKRGKKMIRKLQVQVGHPTAEK